ncbi:CocE/NonD family hydrolase C-terminal non-catalytic domain-containing protein, partial [Streptomyces halstedii]|uniref:CocE/NonD family hydrolase C-terminal non-catalytic domain-containing protein n=1 Tax=Streptomyces halstedii TaxID=1944 RepID=UPI0033BE0035
WARAALAGRLARERRGVITLGGSGRWHAVGKQAADGASTRTVAWPFGAPTGLRMLHGAEFTVDPDRPVRSDDLTVPPSTPGIPADRCLLLSPPLPRPLDLAGPASARFHATADTPAADWAVRVTALDPAGRADPLAFGIVRRADPPGEAVEITVPLGTLGRRLPAGTRLRAEIAGHHFPAHARNPHTGENPVTAIRLAPSRRAVRSPGPVSACHDAGNAGRWGAYGKHGHSAARTARRTEERQGLGTGKRRSFRSILAASASSGSMPSTSQNWRR